MLDLKFGVGKLGQFGQSLAKRLEKLGIETIEDLIFYFPFRHEDFSQVLPIEKIIPGTVGTIKGRIELIKNWRSPRTRRMLTEALISDDSGSIKAIWFNQPYLTKVLTIGERVFLSGKVDFDYQALRFINPVYEVLRSDEEQGTHTARIVPIYSATESITQKQIRALTKMALKSVRLVEDWLPEGVKKEYHLMNLTTALEQIHFPADKENIKLAKHRLKFDELFLIQLQAKKMRKELEMSPAPKIVFREKETKEFVDSLPFRLTNAQRLTSWEILKDLDKGRPMNRLLEGDVGSGKTLVATIGALNTVLNGWQAVFMAPTEILARQHYNTLTRVLDKYPIKICLLTRSESRLKDDGLEFNDFERKELLKKISSGEAEIVIGTHALIQDKVKFKNIGLVIVDEQHRFGVAQRKALKEKNKESELVPHLLSMTATPIPRTLALAFYGDLDLSIIDEMPAGRKKIITRIVEPRNRKKTYEFIRKEIESGRQAMVICPLIDPSDKLGVKSVKNEFEKLSGQVFSDLKVGFIHGRLKAEEKEWTMREFAANKINILVATSVIEVGIDIQNATIMLIEGAERFGLAQLHQFRGRVGRGEYQSYCLLFTETGNEATGERLQALVESDNGFVLAEKDLEQRGQGEMYGRQQSGLPTLKIATLNDRAIIKEASAAAEKIISEDRELEKYPKLKAKLGEFLEVHLE